MKRFPLLTMLFATLFAVPMQARDCQQQCFKATLCDIKEDLDQLLACGAAISITQKDIGTTGVILDQPAVYCLAEDIVFNPASPLVYNNVTFSGDGSGATGFAAVSGGTVQGVIITNGGSGYTFATVSFAGLAGSDAAGTVAVSGGSVDGVAITNGGTGYKDTVQAAITITSPKARLFMNSHSLTQAGAVDASTIPNYSGANVPSSQVPYVVGIYIPDTSTSSDVNAVGVESVYIEGDRAIIDGFSMMGVRIGGHTSDIRLSNITIENCGLLGSYYLRPFAQYQPLPFYYFDSLAVSFGGLYIGETDQGGLGPQFFTQANFVPQNRATSVVLNNVDCLNNFLAGVFATSITNLFITDCHFDGTLNDDPSLFYSAVGGGFGSGFEYELPSNVNMVVRNSSFNNTRELGDFNTASNALLLSNATVTGSSNLNFENCTFDVLTAQFPGANFNTCSLGGSLDNVTWENCSFSNLSGLSGGSNSDLNDGFHLSGHQLVNFEPGDAIISSHGVRLIGCVANNNTGPGCIGYNIDYVKGLVVENCVAANTAANGFDAVGFAIVSGGDNPQIDDFAAIDTVMRGCVAQRTTAIEGGSATGFEFSEGDFELSDPDILQTVLVEDCVAEGSIAYIPSSPTTPQGAGVGFAFQLLAGADSPGYPTSFVGCKALNNQGSPAAYSAGFLEASYVEGQPVQNHSFFNCEADSNVYGFLLSNAENIAVRNCRADNNVTATGTTNNPAIDGIVGSGFVDLGVSIVSTPDSVAQSGSYFESNHAYNNGLGDAFTGVNQNYNIEVDGLGTPVATFNVRVANPNAVDSYEFTNPNKATPVHNISTIKQ